MRPIQLAFILLAPAKPLAEPRHFLARNGPSEFQEIPGEDEGPGPSTTSPPWAPVPNACSVHPKCHEEGLTGACCPPGPGTTNLACCEGGPGCSAYPSCVALGFDSGECCTPGRAHACCGEGPTACEAFSACVESGLTTGICCPSEGQQHPCCSGIVVPQWNKLAESRFCSSHPDCLDLNLEQGAACCPTLDGISLECCNDTAA